MSEAGQKKKVLVIGTGGVGMATRDMITDYIGADVIVYDRPLPEDAEKAQKKLEDRAKKAEDYQRSLEAGTDILDGEQAKWLLQGHDKLSEAERGHVTVIDPNITDYLSALDSGVDAIAITAGKPRSAEMTQRADLGKANAPDFAKYGKKFADYAAKRIAIDLEKAKTSEEIAILDGLERLEALKKSVFHLPVFLNVTNPADATTEVLGRELHAGLARHAVTAQRSGNTDLAKLLAAEARSLKGKILGQGGVLDGSRVATSIHEILRDDKGNPFPLEDVVEAPVRGTHDDVMEWDQKNTKVRHQGKIIPLVEYPGIDLNAKYDANKTNAEEIISRTRGGGSRIKRNYKEVLDIDQSATIATGAAMMKMLDSVLNDKKLTMPAVVYHTLKNDGNFHEKGDGGKGIVMGAMVTLGKDGAQYQAPHADIVKALAAAEKNATDQFSIINESMSR